MKQILLIDNDSMFTGMVNCMLQNEQFTISVARDGKEATNALAKGQYDLVIADMFIPYSNGFELLHDIRTNKEHAQVPVLVVSAVSNTQSIASCYRLGADAYLTKPVNTTHFLTEVRNMLTAARTVAA